MVESGQRDGKLNVYIAYSRDDLDFVDQLDVLPARRLRDDHRPSRIVGRRRLEGSLGALVRDADTFVFVLSPSSARSEICAWEVDAAVRLGKRIIPVICRPLDGPSPPPQLAELNYIYFYPEPKLPGSGFGRGLFDLAKALNTDPDWVREHTRYLRLAKEWEEVGKPPDRRLLSAADIALAKAWATSRPAKAPELTALQLEFIRASEEESIRQASGSAGSFSSAGAALAEEGQRRGKLTVLLPTAATTSTSRINSTQLSNSPASRRAPTAAAYRAAKIGRLAWAL